MRRAALALAALGAVAVPAVASATTYRFGSSLTAPANKIEAHPRDAIFWANALPNGAKFRAPAKGRIKTIKIKGSVVKRNGVTPDNRIHFQTLRPVAGGNVKVILTTGKFYVPIGGDPNRISSYSPVNLCVHQGDYIALHDVGGYKPGSYPNGAPFRVFSSGIAGAVTNFFSGAGANGSTFKGTAHTGEELLMRMVEVTGQEAGSYCNTH